MKNRKEQIIILENEISEKQQTLNELKTEEGKDQYNNELTPEEIEEIINNII